MTKTLDRCQSEVGDTNDPEEWDSRLGHFSFPGSTAPSLTIHTGRADTWAALNLYIWGLQNSLDIYQSTRGSFFHQYQIKGGEAYTGCGPQARVILGEGFQPAVYTIPLVGYNEEKWVNVEMSWSGKLGWAE